MRKNSTLLIIVDDTAENGEIINIGDYVDENGKYSTELDEILSVFDYSPSEDIIKEILMYANQK